MATGDEPEKRNSSPQVGLDLDAITKLLETLQDNRENTARDNVLNQLSYKDFPRLRKAQVELSLKSKDKRLDVIYRARISAMVGTLNLYLDEELSYTWCQASLLAAKSQGRSAQYARTIRTWIHRYIHSEKLPLHCYGRYNSSILQDEDLAQEIQLHLLEMAKEGYVRAQDIVDLIGTPRMQERLGSEEGKEAKITLRTAQRWMHKMDWRYGKKKRGMYIDGHERDDVVAYRKEFVERWKEYERRMVTYDNDGNIDSTPNGFPVAQPGRFRLYLITHDESTFAAHDRRKTLWQHSSHAPTPERKGEGESIMISDFLTPDWGRLIDNERCVYHCS